MNYVWMLIVLTCTPLTVVLFLPTYLEYGWEIATLTSVIMALPLVITSIFIR